MFRQFAIIIGCLAVGEGIVWLTHIPIPSSILGLLLLTAGLQTGVIKEAWVGKLADFLTNNMGFFFVPPGVALMLHLELIQREWLPITVSVLVSTMLVLLITAWTHILVFKLQHKFSKKKSK